MHPKKIVNPLAILCLGTLSVSWLFAAPITITVNDLTDTPANIANGGQFGTTTDLRGALNQVNIAPNPDGYIINFSSSAINTISLGAMLPILNLVQAYPLTIDGGNGDPITIDGGGVYRGFFIKSGTVALKNLKIQNVRAVGGNGGLGGGGGGMGAGAGLFIKEGTTSLSRVTINTATCLGGNGGLGATLASFTFGAGGGLGGKGGDGLMLSGAAGGGGGLGGDGGNASVTGSGGGGGGINCGINHTGAGGSGGMGSVGGGIGGSKAGDSQFAGGLSGGGGGSAINGDGGGGGGLGGSPSSGNDGGDGGFGGGGGSGSPGGASGGGGYGGGGAAYGDGDIGLGGGGGYSGNGGFGAGGGSFDSSMTLNSGGVGGGQGDPDGTVIGEGGGGAGFGGAIFVDTSATLNILDSFSTNTSNATSAGTGFAPGWAAGNDCFFLTGGSITFDPKGSTITISNSIADDSQASFVGVQPGTTPGTAAGAFITIGNPLNASGIVEFPTTNNSTYSGPTLVKNGVFTLNGSITSPVSVFSGATLQGTGTVNNSVTINPGGTIHAGNSIGTFTVGNLTLANQAKLALDIDLIPGSSISSHYIVNGSVSLQTPTLVLSFASQSSPPTSHTYNFIQSTGSVTGTFNPLVRGSPNGLFATVNYFPNLVQLQLSPFSAVIGVGVNLSHNEKVILNYLLTRSTVPTLQPILTDLALLPPNELRAALDSISPARNAATTYFTNQTAFAMGKIPLDRLAEGRIRQFIRSSSNKNSLASVLGIKSDDLLAMDDTLPTTSTPAEFASAPKEQVPIKTLGKPTGNARFAATDQKNYAFWGAGFGDFLSQDKQNSNPKITDTASGLMLGFDYYGYQNGIFTLSSGYVHNDISEKCCAGNGTSNGGVLSFYGTGNIGNGYIEGGFLGGYNRFNMHRNITLPGPLPFNATAVSSFNTWTLMPHLSGGYDWMMDWGIVEPFGSIDWAVTFQESYKEKGAAPLNDKIKSQNPSILRSQLGINFYETWDCEKHAFIFQQSASYINKALFNTKMSAAIILTPTAVPASAPSSFTVWTYDQTLNLGGIGGELFYKHKPTGFFLSGAYQGEFGTSYMSNDITATLGVFF